MRFCDGIAWPFHHSFDEPQTCQSFLAGLQHGAARPPVGLGTLTLLLLKATTAHGTVLGLALFPREWRGGGGGGGLPQGCLPDPPPVCLATVTTEFPVEGLVYDYVFNMDTWKFVPWLDTVTPQVLTVTNETIFSEIIVVTTDVVRYKWIIHHLTTKDNHVLCVGPTGTGVARPCPCPFALGGERARGRVWGLGRGRA